MHSENNESARFSSRYSIQAIAALMGGAHYKLRFRQWKNYVVVRARGNHFTCRSHVELVRLDGREGEEEALRKISRAVRKLAEVVAAEIPGDHSGAAH